MMFRHVVAVFAATALLAFVGVQGAAAPPFEGTETTYAECPESLGASVSREIMDRKQLLRDNSHLRFLIEDHGVAAMSESIYHTLAEGLSDEAVHLMVNSAPLYPRGAPLPTYPPPLPASAASPGAIDQVVLAGQEAEPPFHCGRAFAAFTIYSWWATGICALVEVG